MRIDCISDLHGHYPSLDGGDLLIIAGDLTARDSLGEHLDFKNWFYQQNYKKKIVVAGNHDNHFKNIPPGPYVFSTYNYDTGEQLSYSEYLCDSGCEYEGLKIWGTPWTKTFPGMNPKCKAFTCDTEEELAEKWALIPRNIDILITHGPPFNFLDNTCDGKMVGSTSLLDWVSKWKPQLHIFGHIHEAYGQCRHFFGRRNFGNPYGVTMINASHVNQHYEPVNKPVRIKL